MRILLIGGGFVNKGGEAMTLTAKEELSKRLGGNVSFLLERRNSRVPAGYVETVQEEGFEVLNPSTSLAGRLGLLAQQAARAPARASYLLRHRGKVCKAKAFADRIDAVVDISGFAYADKWGAKKAREMDLLMRETERQGKPYVVMPQTWGPFSSAELRTLVADSCRRAALFFARDATSRQHLAELLGQPTSRILRSPDAAFLFEPSDQSAVLDSFFEKKEIDPAARPTIGVAPNMRVFERNPGIGSNNSYAKVLIETCRACLDRGIDVLLLPHEIKPSDTAISDDRLICNLVETALRGHEGRDGARVAAQEEVWSARATKALVRRCDLVLGSRFHSIVAALSQAVPAVAIGWSFKYQELMGEFGMERFVLDHDDLGEEGYVSNLVAEAWEEREALGDHLEAQLPEVRQNVGRTFDRVARALDTR